MLSAIHPSIPSIHLFIYYISPSNLCMLVGSSQGWHVEEKKTTTELALALTFTPMGKRDSPTYLSCMKSHGDVAQHEKYTLAYPRVHATTAADAQAAIVSHSMLFIHPFIHSSVVSYCYSPNTLNAELQTLTWLRCCKPVLCYYLQPEEEHPHLTQSLIYVYSQLRYQTVSGLSAK